MARKFARKKKAKVGKNVKQYVKKVLDAANEDKYRLTVHGTYAAPVTTIDYNTGYIGLLNGMNQGTGEEQRIGDVIKIKSVEWRYDLTGATAAGVAGQSRARMMMVIDMNNNGGALSPATTVFGDIFNAGTSITTTGVVATYSDITHNKRYKILYDKVINLEVTAAYFNGLTPIVYPGTVTRVVKRRFKRPLRVQYNNSVSGFNTDIVKNSIYILCFSDISSAAAGPAPIMVSTTKIQYEDS